MEQTQLLDWDETELSYDSTEGSQEPVGKLHLCSSAHGPERDFWIHTGDNIIGRHENCHITLPAQSVSKKHAVIEAEADCHVIYDCGSLNKTRRRKVILKPNVRYALADGDLLLFADVACQYYILPVPAEGSRVGVLPKTTAALRQEAGDHLETSASHETSTLEDFDSDDESILVPATQNNAVKSLVFEKTPAVRRMGYGGVLAKDSDEDDDNGDNTINPTGLSRGSEASTETRERGDLCTSAALESPSSATVIPESDDEYADASAISAPSMHLQYDSDTEADESLLKTSSTEKVRRDATAPPKAARPSRSSTEPGSKETQSMKNASVDTNKAAESHASVVTEQRLAQYHLDSDTDVEEEEEAKILESNGDVGELSSTERRPAQFPVGGGKDVEEQPSTAFGQDDPATRNRKQGNATALPPVQGAAQFHLDSDTDVEEDADVPAIVPDLDLGSDTDVEENVDAPNTIGAAAEDTDVKEEPVSPRKELASSIKHGVVQDSDTDVEEDITACRTAVTSKQGAAQDSDTDAEDEPTAIGAFTAQQNSKGNDNAKDSDTDAEEVVRPSRSAPKKKKSTKGGPPSSRKGKVTPESRPVQYEDDEEEETDVDEATEGTTKDDSDPEADENPSLALEATQCFVEAASGVQGLAEDEHSSAESAGEEEAATQAFVFKSPPVKPFKKSSVPSSGGSVLPVPVFTSPEKEEFSDDDENIAVAETQSFCMGPDLSYISLEEEPTQAFFVAGGPRPQGPCTSTQKMIGSETGLVKPHIAVQQPTEVETEAQETTLAEAETQLFYSNTIPATTIQAIEPSENPSQDETQPISVYLGLQAGQKVISEPSNQGVNQPPLISEASRGEQPMAGQKTMALDVLQAENEVETSLLVKTAELAFPSTVKQGACCASTASLLESQDPQRPSVEPGQSEETTQPLSLFLSEEATQAYSIDIAELGPESFGTKPAVLCKTLGDVADTSESSKEVNEGTADRASIEQEDATTQPLESVELPPTREIAICHSISSDMNTASRSGISDLGKTSGQEEEPEAEPSSRTKKKQPALTKRGRKKKTTEEETAAKESVPPALPVAEIATEMMDVNLEAERFPPTACGRLARSTAATSSTSTGLIKLNEAVAEEPQKAEPTKASSKVNGSRKGRLGRGQRRKAAVEEPPSEPVTAVEPMAGPSTDPIPACVTTAVPNVETSALAADTTTASVIPSEAMETPLFRDTHTVDMDTKPTANTIVEVKAAISETSGVVRTSMDSPDIEEKPTSTNLPNTEAASTADDDGQVPDTRIAQRRAGKRSQAAAALSTAEPSQTSLEPGRRGNRNQKKLAASEAETKCGEEVVTVRGKGRQKKAVNCDAGVNQQHPFVATAELSTSTRPSRARKSSTEAVGEGEFRPVPGRARRCTPAEEHHPPNALEENPQTNKNTVETTMIPELEPHTEALAEGVADTKSTAEQKSKVGDSQPSTGHGTDPCLSEQPASIGKQAVGSSQALVDNQAEAPPTEIVLTSDQGPGPGTEQAMPDGQTRSSSVVATYSATIQGAVGKGDELTRNGISISANTPAPRKRRTMAHGKGEVAKDETATDTPPIKKRQATADEEAEAQPPSGSRASRKRGTRQATEEEINPSTASRASRKRGTMEAVAIDNGAPNTDSITFQKRGPIEFIQGEATGETANTDGAFHASGKRGTMANHAEDKTPATAPMMSKRCGTTETAEKEMTVETVTPTGACQASRTRETAEAAEGELTATTETATPTGALRASRTKGTTEGVDEAGGSTSAPQSSRKRGIVEDGEKGAEEVCNSELRGIAQPSRRRTRAASNEESSAVEGERGLRNITERTGGRGKKQAGMLLAEGHTSEQMESLQPQSTQLDAESNQAIVKPEVNKSQRPRGLDDAAKETGGRRRWQAGNEAADSSKTEQESASKDNKRLMSVMLNEGGALELATTTDNQSEEGLKNTVGGLRKQQTESKETEKTTNAGKSGSTDQKRRRNSTASNESTTCEANSSQSEKGLESTAAEGERPKKKQAASLKTSEVENQAEAVKPVAPEVRGRGSQRRKVNKAAEAKTAQAEHSAPINPTKDSQSLPIQEELQPKPTSRSNSRGQKKAQQMDSSQESLDTGHRRRQQSSTSSDGKTEDTNNLPEPETPRRKGRTPNLSNSPSVFREHSSPKVMFTGVIDENGEQVVQRLGGELADSVYDCTHLVTDRIRRTVKFLCAVARGIPIVTLDWLEKSGKNKCFLSPSGFLVKDREQELNFNFRLCESLQRAQKHRLFEGYEIHVTPSVKPEPEFMKDIIQCSGATFLPKMPREYKDKRVIVSCSADLAKCKPALSASLPVTNSEFILTGILQQIANLDTFLLEGIAATTEEASKSRGGKRPSAACSTPPPASTKRRR
ncbi:mediator of DNA damage checkpoint protein 1 isoform X2 [Ambystoma mexicanum]|uniref:mediator of DNA damage checkpoint protein 1 isoform X2 n=1 Tax=Ambystoma mexicanum TaxID=8296 RepID=UPI0037E700FA